MSIQWEWYVCDDDDDNYQYENDDNNDQYENDDDDNDQYENDDDDNDQHENNDNDDDKGGPATVPPSSTWRALVLGEGLIICFTF